MPLVIDIFINNTLTTENYNIINKLRYMTNLKKRNLQLNMSTPTMLLMMRNDDGYDDGFGDGYDDGYDRGKWATGHWVRDNF